MSEDRSMVLRRLLEEHRSDILDVACQHGASNVRLFGSVARGEATEGSDVDLLVTLEPERTLFDFIRLQLALQDLLGVKVDLVEDKALHSLVRDDVLREAVSV